MTVRRTISIPVFMLVGAVDIGVALAWAQSTDETLVIDEPVENDLYAAHRVVEVWSQVNGDVVAAGQRVRVDGNVAGDVIAAAQTVDIRSTVSDDVRAAGQHVRIMSRVTGHLVAAGQRVTIEQSIGDWAWLAGDTVEVLGDIGGNLTVRAREVSINATVDGNVEIVGDELELGPNAAIRGDLKWRSNNAANISPDAQIDGEVVEEPPPSLAEELATGSTYTLPLNTIVATIVLFLLFSRAFRVSAERIATYPGRSLMLGIAVFLGMPLLVSALFFTGVGVSLGFAVLLIYFPVLLLGVLTGLFAISDLLLRKFNQQPVLWQSVAAIFVTVVTVGLLAKIPWFGFVLVVMILLTGVGALCSNSWATLRGVGYRRFQST